MKHTDKILVIVIVAAAGFFSCNGDKANGKVSNNDIPTAGTTTIYVDNTLQPVVEDVVAVFHSVYDRAHIKQVNMTETDLINAMLTDSARVVVMPRLLTEQENAHFKKRKITPEVTHFATDAIAFITNKTAKDSVIDLNDVIRVIKGETSGKIEKLVFDNPNSSTLQYLLKLAGASKVPTANVYSLKSNVEVIKYVHNTPGAIGIVGVNWLTQPPQDLAEIVSDIKVLGVDNVKIDKGVKKYYKPSQSNIATGSYPLLRKLYVLNYSGREGLGTGFATYMGAFEGQRIILKSGLLPIKIPPREIEVRNEL